jgi:hypothetical protein
MNRYRAGLLFFAGSVVLSPIGYLLGTGLGGLLASSVAGVSSHEMSRSEAAMWWVFGGAIAATSALNVLLFVWMAPRVLPGPTAGAQRSDRIAGGVRA